MTFYDTFGLDTSFYTGTGNQPPEDVPALMAVSIGAREYGIQPTKLTWTTVPPLRQSMDQAPEPGEVSLNNAGAWRRSQSDWKLGARQFMFDETDSKRSRFWSSKGVNPHPDSPDNDHQLRLHKDVQKDRTSGNSNLALCVAGTRLYLLDGNEVYFAIALAGVGTTWTAAGFAVATGGAALASISSDGAFVYAATSGGDLYRSALGDTFAYRFMAVNHGAGGAWYANGRLMVTAGRSLLEVNASGQANGDTLADLAQTTASLSGTVTSVPCSPLPVALSSGNVITLWYGGAAQNFTVGAAGAPVGASSIPVTSVTLVGTWGKGQLVYSAGTAATGLLSFSHYNPSFRWVKAISSPHGTFACGSSGQAGELYLVGTDTATGALNAPQSMFILPDGETLNDMVYYSGALIIATSQGMRVAEVRISFVLSVTYGPVILINQTSGGVPCAYGYGQWAWFGWTNYDGVSTGLGRLDLARFATDLTPAVSSDVMATGQGAISAVANFAGVAVFCVSGVGVYSEHPTNYVASGVIDVGRIKYSTTEPKLPLFVDLYHSPLPVGASISVATVDDFATTAPGGVSNIAGSIHPAQLLELQDTVPVEQVELQITVTNGSDLTNPPVLKRWTLYALPAPRRVDQIDLPLQLSRRVKTTEADGGDEYYDTLDHFMYLKGLERAQTPVPVRIGDWSGVCIVAACKLEGDRLDPVDHHFIEGTLTVSVITLGSLEGEG